MNDFYVNIQQLNPLDCGFCPEKLRTSHTRAACLAVKLTKEKAC